MKRSIRYPSPRLKPGAEPVRNTFKQDEIVHEIARLGNRLQCPVCAATYGTPAMMRNVYQPMQRINDVGDFRCIVCGTLKQI